MDNNSLKTIATGFIGTGTSVGAAIYSLLPHLEAWMRLASVSVGLLVAVLTAIKLIIDIRVKNQKNKE